MAWWGFGLYLWFVTLHPFDGGNGCIARAIGDLLLARADGSPQHFYSLSAQIQRERKAYYEILERTQKRPMDVTEWLAWFLDALHRAVDQAQHRLDAVLTKARFWQHWTAILLSERQESAGVGVSLEFHGAPERIRTSDLCLRRATLYPAELRARNRETGWQKGGAGAPASRGRQ